MTVGKIRLACSSCDRDDFDGAKRVPKNWADVIRVQSWKESQRVNADGDRSFSSFEWYTHLGTCPECQEEDK